MRHFFAWMLALLLLTSTLIASSIVVGWQQPALTHAQRGEFGLCDGEPCFWSVVAGITPFDEASAKIRNFVVTEARPGRLPFFLTWLELRGNFYWDQPRRVVTAIGLAKRLPRTPSTLPMLLELSLLYGEPCAVQPYSQSVMLIFPHLWADFPREGVNLTLASRPETIMYNNVSNDLCAAPADVAHPRQPWQGVAAFAHYASR